MSRLDRLQPPLAKAEETVPLALLAQVLLEEYGWQRAMVADLLRELRKRL